MEEEEEEKLQKGKLEVQKVDEKMELGEKRFDVKEVNESKGLLRKVDGRSSL